MRTKLLYLAYTCRYMGDYINFEISNFDLQKSS